MSNRPEIMRRGVESDCFKSCRWIPAIGGEDNNFPGNVYGWYNYLLIYLNMFLAKNNYQK